MVVIAEAVGAVAARFQFQFTFVVHILFYQTQPYTHDERLECHPCDINHMKNEFRFTLCQFAKCSFAYLLHLLMYHFYSFGKYATV